MSETVLALLAIHPSNEVFDARDFSFHVKPGYYYEYFISKVSYKLLESPYQSNCKNYDHSYYKKRHQFLHKPMSKADCFKGCLALSTVNECNCWPPEIPYIWSNNTGYIIIYYSITMITVFL